jgi:hypothetical protein
MALELSAIAQCGFLRGFFNRRSPHCGRGQSTFMGLARAAGSYGSRFTGGDRRAIEANQLPSG